MRIAFVIAVLAVLAVLGLRAAAASDRPVVVELFTSQGCSSCPPADAFLRDLATRDDVLPLAFHVTYWNRLGWHDPFSLEAGTDRQRLYAALLGQRQVYTPQMVIDGRRQAVGSDRAAVTALIRAAAEQEGGVTVTARRIGDEIGIAVDGTGTGEGTGRALVLLVGYDPSHRTAVGRGENGGRTLLEANIVRSLDVAGEWRGEAVMLQARAGAGERFAVLLQAGDGAIIGAARVE
ncbi:DUF1223 domain-containing protein [Zavarzinia compransoris]|uniref:DUF1223 domain-containing protein n=1 Tax=Zavarzinia marina TaxID=2911065 RepID=UPI001F354E76|nr:DUF1223 domain-containing protein [Zavarzinia marina]MCF4165694.1 DUF1223 domain-containing protein [Zavarzinia marina]